MGVGSELNGDDAVGIQVARKLKHRLGNRTGVLILEGGSLPENATSPLRQFNPAFVVLVDATDLGQPPGTIQIVPVETISGMSFSSHTMPLSMLSYYLEQEIGCEVVVIGIQPASLEFGEEVSPVCRRAANRLVNELYKIIETAFTPEINILRSN